ncbi:hypothetical protein Pmani_036989, partial [Petrolisthes manimaculis]
MGYIGRTGHCMAELRRPTNQQGKNRKK